MAKGGAWSFERCEGDGSVSCIVVVVVGVLVSSDVPGRAFGGVEGG
jgi:hypothetical protein